MDLNSLPYFAQHSEVHDALVSRHRAVNRGCDSSALPDTVVLKSALADSQHDLVPLLIKLRLEIRPVDNRQDMRDLAMLEPVKGMLSEMHPAPIGRSTTKWLDG